MIIRVNKNELKKKHLRGELRGYGKQQEGVRNLKRCIESIISKINIYYLTGNGEEIDLNFKIKDFILS